MKKFLSVLLTIVLMLSVCGVAPALAADTDQVYFTLVAGGTTLSPGQTLSVTLKGGNLQDVEGAQFYIDFDPALFEISGDAAGKSLMPEGWDCSMVKSKTAGRLLYMAYRDMEGEPLEEGELRMHTFTLKVKADVPTCTTDISIDIVKVCDRNASDLWVYDDGDLQISIDNPDRPILPPRPSVSDGIEIYEAEDAQVDGGQVRDINDGSGGRLVGQLGNDGGSVTFTIETDFEGERQVDIYYNSAQDRRFDIIVNDSDESIVAECPGEGNWNETISISTVTIYLNAGVNTITFDRYDGPAPNLDRIEVEKLREMTAAEEFAYLVDQIGEVTSLKQEPQVKAARAAYDALDEAGKASVADKLLTLVAAEAVIDALREMAGLPGDVDFSEVVDVADIMKIKTLIMTEEWSESELLAGDLNASNSLDVGDIMGIKSIIMGQN